MALVPAYQMAGELPPDRQALPVLKVLYRNSSRIQEQTGRPARHVASRRTRPNRSTPAKAARCLRDAVRAVDWDGAEARFAAIAEGLAGEAFNQLQFAVQDEVNVHRVVLAWRAWAMLELTGEEYAHTLLRQSVRFCVDTEQHMRDQQSADVRGARRVAATAGRVPPVEQTARRSPGRRCLGRTSSRGRSSPARATRLPKRPPRRWPKACDPEGVGEAISLAANLLVLHDPGRREENSTPQKPPGCVHGDSVGVHASDAANAWRNIARVSNPRNTVASLIVGAYHTAGQFSYGHQRSAIPMPHLLDEIDSKDAATCCSARPRKRFAATTRPGRAPWCIATASLKLPARPVFDLLLKYAVSEDGALHAEKYYRTVSEEFATTRPAFRWRQLVALARVTASEHGFPAPGFKKPASC